MTKIQSKVMEDWVWEIRDDTINFYQETEDPEDDHFTHIEDDVYEEPRIDIVTDMSEETTNLYLSDEFVFSTTSDHVAWTYWICYDLAFELAEIIYDHFNKIARINISSDFYYQPDYEKPVK